MDKPPTTDNELDRALPKGALSGPEADRLWARIAPTVPQAQSARRPWWARPRLWVGVGSLAAAAVLVMVMPGSQDGFRPRGANAGPYLESSCGQGPCVVGQPVFLRLVHTGPPGALYVAVKDARNEPAWLSRGTPAPTGTHTLEVQLTPEASDVAGGIDLMWWVVPQPVAANRQDALLGMQPAPDGSLHLTVHVAHERRPCAMAALRCRHGALATGDGRGRQSARRGCVGPVVLCGR